MKNDKKSIPEGKFAPEDWEYLLLQMVNDRSGVDFGMYRMPTFRRRYLKRMKLIGAGDLRSFVKMLEDDPSQLDNLVKDLLIGVTSFFRDQPAFRVFRDSAVKQLFKRTDNANIRCWVAGCSNGMEAYSIAILMQSASEKLGGSYTIFATDVSRPAIVEASKGIYTSEQYETVPAEYRKYFSESGNSFKIKREIRANMVFSHHDILSDPPFANMDIVSCRNMMIYLKQKAQDVVLGRLNYSLSVGGFLFLGSGETPGRHNENLETVDSRWRIFRKTSETVISVEMFPFEKQQDDAFSVFGVTDGLRENEDELRVRSRTFTSCLEERFFPDCVFIDEDYRILFIHGDMNAYLSIPSGIPGGSLLQMLPGQLKSAIRAGVRRAKGRFRRIQCDTGSETTIYVSCISPLEMSGVFLIEFIRSDPDTGESIARIECSESDISILEEQIALLESDLATTRRELRSRSGELQASNEELQTSNEEIRSANEELISSNEELLASNEELQKVNRQLTVISDDMKNLHKSMDVGSLFLDNDFRIRRFNPMVSRFFKITRRDIGRSITDFNTMIERSSLETLLETVRNVSSSGDAIEISLTTEIPGFWLAKVSPYRSSEGVVQGTVITFVDVTVLREGELSLARSERKFRGLFNGFPMGALLVSHEEGSETFEILDRNPAFQLLCARSADLSSNRDFARGIVQETALFEFTHLNRDYRCQVFKTADFAQSLCVTVRDVSEMNRAADEKAKLEKRLHEAQLLAGMGLWEYNRTERTLRLSEEAAELFGMDSGGPLPLEEFNSRINDFKEFLASTRESLKKTGTYSGTVSGLDMGTTGRRYFKVSCYILTEDKGNTVYGYALDVTSEVLGERILKQANEKLAETQRIARIGLIEMEWNSSCTMHRERFSSSAIQVLKLKEGDQADIFSSCMEEDLAFSVVQKLRKCACGDQQLSLDIPMKNGEGENVFIQIIARLKETEEDRKVLTLVIMDITRRHQLENELKHSEKLRSVGELAGGIAHDFNNQLMGIVGFAECLRQEGTSPEGLEYVKGILGSAERAGALVRQLLAFSRKGLSHIAPFDLHHQIDEVITLLKRSIDRRVEIRRDFRASNAMILGDASEMNNAILNLALNARDAINGSGEMIFYTGDRQDGYMEFSLTDTGKGMTPDLMAKVFEPFFTTKTLGNGTGMGLPAVYGTVEAHNGTIDMTSTPGEGTRVTISLPVTTRKAHENDLELITDNIPMEGKVLLVDDEEIVRSVLSKLVESLGFEVVTASDGVQAVDIFREHRNSIKLVLMDMTMPRKNGMDAFIEMRAMDPYVKVIILSGHSAESTSNEMIGLGVCKVLQKPVMLSVLSDAIRETAFS